MTAGIQRIGLSWPGSTPEWLTPGRLPGAPGSRPGPLDRPHRPEMPAGTPDQGVAPWLEQRMFEQQVVAVSGPVTAALSSRIGAQLMTLDALSNPRSGPIRLQISSVDGDLSAAFALIDVLDLMRTPVQATAIGTVGGAALGIYAAASERLAYRHTRFRLAEPQVDEMAGTADEVAHAAGAHLRLLDDLIVRLATVSGHPRAQIERDLSSRRELSATEAVGYGLAQRAVGR